MRLSTERNGETRSVEFLDTLFVPDLRANLISIAKITDHEHVVIFVTYRDESPSNFSLLLLFQLSLSLYYFILYLNLSVLTIRHTGACVRTACELAVSEKTK